MFCTSSLLFQSCWYSSYLNSKSCFVRLTSRDWLKKYLFLKNWTKTYWIRVLHVHAPALLVLERTKKQIWVVERNIIWTTHKHQSYKHIRNSFHSHLVSTTSTSITPVVTLHVEIWSKVFTRTARSTFYRPVFPCHYIIMSFIITTSDSSCAQSTISSSYRLISSRKHVFRTGLSSLWRHCLQVDLSLRRTTMLLTAFHHVSGFRFLLFKHCVQSHSGSWIWCLNQSVHLRWCVLDIL